MPTINDATVQQLRDYAEYVGGKIEIGEMPFTFDQFLQAEEDLRDE